MNAEPERPDLRWLSWRRASIKTGLPARVLRELLVQAGVRLYRPTPRRELVDVEQLEDWMVQQRVPTAEEAARISGTVRARVLARMAQRREVARA